MVFTNSARVSGWGGGPYVHLGGNGIGSDPIHDLTTAWTWGGRTFHSGEGW